MSKKQLILSVNDFKELLIEISENTQWSDHARNVYSYSEFIAMGISDRKEAFYEYVKEEDVEELIDQEYWNGIFDEIPVFDKDEKKLSGFEA